MKKPTKVDSNSIVIFGGSFDPVQNAHIEIIQKLSERFGKVFVVPSFISPFKKEGASASADLRLKMLHASLSKAENVSVSEVETGKPGISYTYDTVLDFKEKSPQVRISLAIGSDMLAGLQQWNRFEELKKIASFYVIGRDGFFINDTVVRKLLKSGAELTLADFSCANVSSAKVRLDAAFNIFDSVPKAVAKIMQKEKLYREFEPIVLTYKDFGLQKERIDHIYQTAATAINLAKIHGADINDALTAALLHDIAKDADESWLKKQGILEPAEVKTAPAKVQHAFWGAEAVKAYFKIRKKSIVDAVRFHTTGAPQMDKLAKIIYLADYTEPTRDLTTTDLDKIRALAEKDLNAAMAAALAASVQHIRSNGREVYPLTLSAYEHFLNPGKKNPQKTKLIKTEPKKIETKKVEPIKAEAKRDPNTDSDELAHYIAACLDEKKGRDITLIDLNNKTIIADYFVIASALSTTAVRALTDYVDERLSKFHGIEPLRRDLDPKWAAIDYGSVILHIQIDEIRKFYDLERLWSDGTNVKRF